MPEPEAVGVSEVSLGVVDRSRPKTSLDGAQRVCVAGRLDRDPGLVAALGSGDPTSSPRWGEVLPLISDCVRSTAVATEWAAAIGDQLGAGATPQMLACLRDGMAGWSAEEHESLIYAGLNPGSADPVTGRKVRDLLDRCGVPVDELRVPGQGG